MSMFVVEMPRTRTRPGARWIRRATGCGGCDPRVRLVTGADDTNTRPPSTFTSYDGTASISNPGSPSPVLKWYFQWCHGQVTYSPSMRPSASGPPAWLHTPESAPNTPPTCVIATFRFSTVTPVSGRFDRSDVDPTSTHGR